MDEWVSAKEAAEIAGVSRQYMHNMANKFQSASRISGTILVFQRTEIVEWAQTREAAYEREAAMADRDAEEREMEEVMAKLAVAI